MALDNIPFLILVVLILAWGYASYIKPSDKLLAQLPTASDHKGLLGPLRNRLSSLGNVNQILGVAYDRFSKYNRPFVLTGMQANVVLLPPTEVRWLIEQPDHVLSAKLEQKDSLQTDRTLLDASLADVPLHENIIRRELTRQIGSLIPEVEDELAAAFTDCFGADTEEWREVCVFEAMMKVVSRASNRVFVGLPLCRNEDYLTNAANFATDIAISSAMLRLFPNILKPLVAPLILLPNRWHLHKCNKYLVPLVKSRIANDLSTSSSSTSSSTSSKPDFLSWSIAEARTSPDPAERSPWKLAMRIMTVNFAAIHTSTFTATNLLLDFFSSPTTTSDIHVLRAEVEGAYVENGGRWDKHAVSRLVKTDSAMRESMRASIFMSHGMTRQVVAPGGVTTGGGLHLPFGTKVGVASWAIHHDSDMYDDAGTYKPFRFSSAREQVAKMEEEGEKKSPAKFLEAKNLSAVTTSDTFLGFGHGKHACPGRFFASAEIKMLLAYVAMNYDVEPLPSRPANTYFGGTILPPMKATLRVRRRKVSY